MMPGSRKLSKVGEGGGSRIKGFFFLGGGGEGLELRGSGPQVPNPGLCMVIILKIFKMKEKNALERHIARLTYPDNLEPSGYHDCMRCIMRKKILHM